MIQNQIKRCDWVSDDALYIRYHDEEWGKFVDDDQTLFEFLILESFQAGLSWLIVLRKRENFRKAFDDFNYNIIATYNLNKVNELINNKGIIRNKLKIESSILNAQLFIEIQKEFGCFKGYLMSFETHFPVINHHKNLKEIPTHTNLSDLISKDLRKRGFKFLGTTILYSFLQATGFVMDHTTDCFRYHQLSHL